MKITLLKASKLGKVGEVVEASAVDGRKAIDEGIATWPSVDDLKIDASISADQARKALGMPTMAEYQRDVEQREANEAKRLIAIRKLGPIIDDHGLPAAESKRREDAKARALANA